ncbi:MAG: M15 family metallopeptidase [Bacillota bacterium]|nr:M15 family metallopeptidase [Bacillota bacterium]
MKNTGFKKLKGPILIVLLLILVLKVFPRLGLYTYLFDRGSYEALSLGPSEPVADLDQLTPRTKDLAEKFLYQCKTQGLEVKIVETYRPQERQNWLYSQGRTRDGAIVTWTRNSRHSSRYAFDICKSGPDPYGDTDFFRKCAEIGSDLGLNCGYFWADNQDMGHYQYDTWWN